MPAQALFNSAIEQLLNSALAEDPTAKTRLKPVRGRTFRLRLQEFSWPITLFFDHDKVTLLGSDYESVDGEVEASVAVLGKLGDTSEVTAAIQHGEIKLSGDPIFAQQASQVFLGLKIDWEEAAAKRFGDVSGYWLSQGIQKISQNLPNPTQWRRFVSDVLTEEKKLTLGSVEYAIFEDDLRALERRILKLEAKD